MEPGSVSCHYTAVWRIEGANSLLGDAPRVVLVEQRNPHISAYITRDPELSFVHIERSLAIANILLRRLVASGSIDSIDAALTAEIESLKARRASEMTNGVFVVFEGDEDSLSPDFKARRDFETFSVCIDAFDKGQVKEKFRPFVQGILISLAMSFRAEVEKHVRLLGDVIYLWEGSDKPIYALNLHSSAMLSLATPLTQEASMKAGERGQKLIKHKAISRLAGLAATSLDRATGDLQAFVAAWSALEIFVTSSFSRDYQHHLYRMIREALPSTSLPAVDRVKDVMSDKYRLTDKFVVVASILNPGEASQDIEQFGALKESRDRLFHGSISVENLPTEKVQNLLLKYMALYLDSRE